MIGLVVLYDVRAYRNFSSPEAMDAAQVARNLAEGHGYATDFIRPFSVYLVQKHNRATHPAKIQTTNAQPRRDASRPRQCAGLSDAVGGLDETHIAGLEDGNPQTVLVGRRKISALSA